MSRRCDHDAKAPRLHLRIDVVNNLPRFVADIIVRARLIYTQPHRFPEFTGEAFAPGMRVRMRRSSHREAVALTLAALGRRCDRRTLRVGDQRDDGLCSGVPITELCKHTGLSPSRCKRAIASLETAGYIRSVQPVVRLRAPRQRPRGGEQLFAGLPAVRVLTPLLLRRQGFTARKVQKARRRGYEDWMRRRGRPLSPVAVVAAHRDLTRLFAANREREGRIADAAVLAEPHVRPPGPR